jgi:hypothetical protein
MISTLSTLVPLPTPSPRGHARGMRIAFFFLLAALGAGAQTKETPKEKPRVYVQAAPPIVDALQRRCPELMISTDRTKTHDYQVIAAEAQSLWVKRVLMTIVTPKGKVVHQKFTSTLGNAAKDACAAILKDSAVKPEPMPAK